jgi:hypothetical protein
LGQFFLKKSKRRRFSKKKSTGCNRVFDRVNPLGHTGFFFLYFFFNPARFQPLVGRVPGLSARLSRVSKLCPRLLDNMSKTFWSPNTAFHGRV